MPDHSGGDRSTFCSRKKGRYACAPSQKRQKVARGTLIDTRAPEVAPASYPNSRPPMAGKRKLRHTRQTGNESQVGVESVREVITHGSTAAFQS